MLYGNSECEPQTDIVVAQVAQEFYNNNLLYSLICNLSKIDFEVSAEFCWHGVLRGSYFRRFVGQEGRCSSF